MKPQALKRNTVVYFHTRWRCVSRAVVAKNHRGRESSVCLESDVSVFVPWSQVFLSDREAELDLQRTTNYTGDSI